MNDTANMPSFANPAPLSKEEAGRIADISARQEVVQPVSVIYSDADYRAALHNPETPQPVKRAIKKHLHGSPGGRREVRQQYNMSHTITAGERTSSGPKRPAGVSARQWKKQRSAVRRVMKAIEARA